MNAAEFANLQEALVWVLGPLGLWMMTLILACSVFAAIFVVWMALLRRLA